MSSRFQSHSNSKMAAEASSSKLEAVSDVDIDAGGKFKYVLISVVDTTCNASKHIVRGYEWAAYHADIYEQVSPALEGLGLKTNCAGGGRIHHNRQEKSILVYGYSMGFGRADHSIAVEKLKAEYPDYTSITFSNDGY